MKRSIIICSLVCLILFTCTLFAGCGPNNTVGSTPTPAPSEPTQQEIRLENVKAGDKYRILIWNTIRENLPLEPDQDGSVELREKVDKLEAEYGVEVVYVQATNDWLNDAMRAASTGEPICDVIHAGQPGALPGLYAYNGIAGSVVESITAQDMEHLFKDEQFWNTDFINAAGYYDNQMYFVIPEQSGFGSVGLNQVTFFNKNMLASAGYSADAMYEMSEKGEWTFDKLREVCIALTDPDKGTYGMCMGATSIAMCSMVTSNNGMFVTKVDGVDRFTAATDPNVVEAVNFFVEMAKTDKSVYLGNYVDEEIKGFSTGTYGIMLTYANRAQQLYDKDNEVEFGIIMPPKGPRANDYISEVNWYDAWCVMKNTPNPKGSIEVMSVMVSPAYGRDSAENLAKLESSASIVCYDNQSVQNLIKVRDKSRPTNYQTYCWLSDNSSGFGFGNGILYCCLQFIDGSKTPQVYFESVTDAANAIIDRYTVSK